MALNRWIQEAMSVLPGRNKPFLQRAADYRDDAVRRGTVRPEWDTSNPRSLASAMRRVDEALGKLSKPDREIIRSYIYARTVSKVDPVQGLRRISGDEAARLTSNALSNIDPGVVEEAIQLARIGRQRRVGLNTMLDFIEQYRGNRYHGKTIDPRGRQDSPREPRELARPIDIGAAPQGMYQNGRYVQFPTTENPSEVLANFERGVSNLIRPVAQSSVRTSPVTAFLPRDQQDSLAGILSDAGGQYLANLTPQAWDYQIAKINDPRTEPEESLYAAAQLVLTFVPFIGDIFDVVSLARMPAKALADAFARAGMRRAAAEAAGAGIRRVFDSAQPDILDEVFEDAAADLIAQSDAARNAAEPPTPDVGITQEELQEAAQKALRARRRASAPTEAGSQVDSSLEEAARRAREARQRAAAGGGTDAQAPRPAADAGGQTQPTPRVPDPTGLDQPTIPVDAPDIPRYAKPGDLIATGQEDLDELTRLLSGYPDPEGFFPPDSPLSFKNRAARELASLDPRLLEYAPMHNGKRLGWNDDITRALYIVARKKTKPAVKQQFIRFLKNNGFSDEDIAVYSQEALRFVDDIVSKSDLKLVTIPSLGAKPGVRAAEAAAAAAPPPRVEQVPNAPRQADAIGEAAQEQNVPSAGSNVSGGVKSSKGGSGAAGKAASADNAEPKAPPTKARINRDAVLPEGLRKSSPRYKTRNLRFEDDVTKALYIVGNPSKRSAAHDKFVQFLRDAGFTDSEIDEYGKRARDLVKETAEESYEEVVSIPRVKIDSEPVKPPRASRVRAKQAEAELADAAERARKSRKGIRGKQAGGIQPITKEELDYIMLYVKAKGLDLIANIDEIAAHLAEALGETVEYWKEQIRIIASATQQERPKKAPRRPRKAAQPEGMASDTPGATEPPKQAKPAASVVGAMPEGATGARNRITTAERMARGLDPVDPGEYPALEEAYNIGRQAVERGEVDPHMLATRIVDHFNGSGAMRLSISAEDVGALAYDRQRLVNALSAAKTPEEHMSVLEALSLNDQALRYAGRSQSIAFQARKIITMRDYSPAALEAEVRMLYQDAGQSDQLVARVKKLADRLSEVERELEETKRIANSEVIASLKQLSKKRGGGKSRVTGRTLEEIRGDMSNRFVAFKNRAERIASGDDPTPIASGFDPELAKLILDTAADLVDYGITSVDSIIGEIVQVAKNADIYISEKDVRGVLYSNTERTAAEVKHAVKQLRELSEVENARKELRNSARAGKGDASKTVKAVRKKIESLRTVGDADRERWLRKIEELEERIANWDVSGDPRPRPQPPEDLANAYQDAVKTLNMQRQIVRLRAQLASGITREQRKVATLKSKRLRKLTSERDLLRAQIDEELLNATPQSFVEKATIVLRNMALTNISARIIDALFGASRLAEDALFLPMDSLLDAIMQPIYGKANAGRVFSVDPFVYKYAFAGRENIANLLRKQLLIGDTEVIRKIGKTQLRGAKTELGRKIQFLLTAPSRITGISDTVVKDISERAVTAQLALLEARKVLGSSYPKRALYRVANNIIDDIDEGLYADISDAAIAEGLNIIFADNSWGTRMLEGAFGGLKRSGTVGEIAHLASDVFVMRFARIFMLIQGLMTDHAYGALKALSEYGGWRSSGQPISAAQKRRLVRLVRRNGVGAASIYFGYIAYQNGMLEPRTSDNRAYWQKPEWVQAHPLLGLVWFGAALSEVDRGVKEGIYSDREARQLAQSAIVETFVSQPAISGPERAMGAITGSRDIGDVAVRSIANSAIPALARDTARRMDIMEQTGLPIDMGTARERDPQTPAEEFMVRIPLLRQRVPFRSQDPVIREFIDAALAYKRLQKKEELGGYQVDQLTEERLVRQFEEQQIRKNLEYLNYLKESGENEEFVETFDRIRERARAEARAALREGRVPEDVSPFSNRMPTPPGPPTPRGRRVF